MYDKSIWELLETNSSSNTSKTDNLSERNNNGRLISAPSAISGFLKRPNNGIRDEAKCSFLEFFIMSDDNSVTKYNSSVKTCMPELQIVKKLWCPESARRVPRKTQPT